MALTNKKTTNTSFKSLSIQISLSGLSFCVLNSQTKTIETLKQVRFEKKITPSELIDSLQNTFNTEKTLNDNFNSVLVIHENNLCSHVPKTLFNDANLADYLKFNTKILKTDFIASDVIKANESVTVYVPYVNVNNFIYDNFGEFTYKHYSTVLINTLLLKEKNANDTKLYVHVSINHFEIIAIKNGNLLLYNSFEHTSKEDFIYYILFVIEQLKLNPETVNTQFLGAINKDDDLYKIAYKYIRHIAFVKETTRSITSEKDTINFVLLNSF